MENVSTKGRIS